MNWDLVVLIVVGSGVLGLVLSKERNPFAIAGVSIAFIIAACIIILLVVICQDLWIFHNWLQTVK